LQIHNILCHVISNSLNNQNDNKKLNYCAEQVKICQEA